MFLPSMLDIAFSQCSNSMTPKAECENSGYTAQTCERKHFGHFGLDRELRGTAPEIGLCQLLWTSAIAGLVCWHGVDNVTR